MLTAMLAVENIAAGNTDKSNIWAVNAEMVYHEEQDERQEGAKQPSGSPSHLSVVPDVHPINAREQAASSANAGR